MEVSRRVVLLPSVAMLAAVIASPLIPRSHTYPGTVIHVHITADSRSAIGPVDFWFDPQAHLWRTTIATTKLNMYISCPGTSPCRMAQWPDFRATVPNAPPRWPDVLNANLDNVPPHHRRARTVQLGGKPYWYFALTLPHAPTIQRQYWLDPSTGMIVRYRELVAGQVVEGERRERTILPPGSLPEGFFQPPPPGGSWTDRLCGWLQDHLLPR